MVFSPLEQFEIYMLGSSEREICLVDTYPVVFSSHGYFLSEFIRDLNSTFQFSLFDFACLLQKQMC